jgi:glycosyltransferase involved in cell wall biosynthesis
LDILPDSKKFKILHLSNAHWILSGYGVQTRGQVFKWNEVYDVRELAIYGLQGTWRGEVSPHNPKNMVITYPTLWGDDHGDKTARLIFQSWMPDVFVTLYDIWMGAYTDYNKATGQCTPIHPYWIPQIMVDHEPIPDKTLVQAQAAYKAVAVSRHGEAQLRSRGVDCTYIPFGIDTGTFKPTEDKRADKAFLNEHSVPLSEHNKSDITKDDFVAFINGANKDPQRKGHPRMMTAIQIFLANNPDVHDFRYYINSWAILARDLPHLAVNLGIEKYGRITSDYTNLCGIPEHDMPRLYGASDVFLHLSEGGGFEVPILEALACGVSVIGSDFICMTELVKDHGWLIPAIRGEKRFLAGARREVRSSSVYFDQLDALQQIDDEYAAAEALEDAYNHGEKRQKYGEEARVFALNFDWSRVHPMWFKLFEEIRAERRIAPLAERRLA